ncbi:MAG: AtpZ/AtpI family protein [Desulfovibrionales bacterium]
MFFKIKDKEYWQTLSKAWMVGLNLVSGTFIGLLMGIFLDRWLGTNPWLTIIFLILGIIAGFKNVFQEIKRIQDHDSRSGKPGP